MLVGFEIPKGLSLLAKHDANAFVPGIEDLIDGIELNAQGDTIHTMSYAERIESGKWAQAALAAYETARKAGDTHRMDQAVQLLKANYANFGYGYLDSPEDAVPPVALTFYAFRIMVMAGGYLMLFFIASLFMCYKKPEWFDNKLVLAGGLATIAIVWICSEAGWVVAEVGRQPWVIQDLMPAKAAISAIGSGSVQLTFWIFVVLFTLLMCAEIGIMVSQINKDSKKDLLSETNN